MSASTSQPLGFRRTVAAMTRWLVVLGAAAALVITPLALEARPAKASDVPVEILAARVSASAGVGWSGSVQSEGTLQLPANDSFATLGQLLGERNDLRAWWRSPTDLPVRQQARARSIGHEADHGRRLLALVVAEAVGQDARQGEFALEGELRVGAFRRHGHAAVRGHDEIQPVLRLDGAVARRPYCRNGHRQREQCGGNRCTHQQSPGSRSGMAAIARAGNAMPANSKL